MKKIIALVLALMMACSLVACGGKDEPASTATSTSTAASTTDEALPPIPMLIRTPIPTPIPTSRANF